MNKSAEQYIITEISEPMDNGFVNVRVSSVLENGGGGNISNHNNDGGPDIEVSAWRVGELLRKKGDSWDLA